MVVGQLFAFATRVELVHLIIARLVVEYEQFSDVFVFVCANAVFGWHFKDIELAIKLSDFGRVIDGHDELALHLGQQVAQSGKIFSVE